MNDQPHLKKTPAKNAKTHIAAAYRLNSKNGFGLSTHHAYAERPFSTSLRIASARGGKSGCWRRQASIFSIQPGGVTISKRPDFSLVIFPTYHPLTTDAIRIIRRAGQRGASTFLPSPNHAKGTFAMATQGPSTSAWIIHHGNGCPLPKGTLIDVRLHNGEVLQRITVGGITVDLDGSIISRHRGRWSAWDYSDGGPMAPKFKAYRLCEEVVARNAAMFASWLDVRELVE